ncbi:MAG: nadR, partial [Microbacterium sp.]|nr:nadR [Microbacterium sp.]
LTGDEIPFVQDGTRDGEHIRHGMQERFRRVLSEQSVPWLEVRGSVPARVAAALPAVRDAVARALRFALPLEQRPWDEQAALRAAHESARVGSE